MAAEKSSEELFANIARDQEKNSVLESDLREAFANDWSYLITETGHVLGLGDQQLGILMQPNEEAIEHALEYASPGSEDTLRVLPTWLFPNLYYSNNYDNLGTVLLLGHGKQDISRERDITKKPAKIIDGHKHLEDNTIVLIHAVAQALETATAAVNNRNPKPTISNDMLERAKDIVVKPLSE